MTFTPRSEMAVSTYYARTISLFKDGAGATPVQWCELEGTVPKSKRARVLPLLKSGKATARLWQVTAEGVLDAAGEDIASVRFIELAIGMRRTVRA
jgi:hypothetical protein